ncbi:hypothetical protein DFH05DRAFT_1399005 [Lentinula detonsa]|uniref:Fucose-specific lectin n=1 Tax=Lentinula detonsa TaxID=2804962 RepID=A0A9W8NZE5_9AGAR|nr:hypothetical protein DFH05DRAFT_1399005 [Lentinula detonsa]KAJ3982180.1 hypothetical protein F5890DRAFT_1416284 [Lentinula detonsa]
MKAIASNLTANAIVPISGTNMGAVELPDGNTRVYYQDGNNGSIIQLIISNALTEGGYRFSNVWVPPSEVRYNTPVAVSLVQSDDTFQQIHVFFFSPDNILSEYYWKGDGPTGGPDCSDCVTGSGFVGVEGSQMLYALASSATSPPTLRVGFISTGSPNTITEAVKTTGGWSLASLTST